MIIEAHDTETGEKQYFDLNFAASNGSTFDFVWFDGRRRRMQIRTLSEPPADTEVTPAAFDVASREIVVQTGR